MKSCFQRLQNWLCSKFKRIEFISVKFEEIKPYQVDKSKLPIEEIDSLDLEWEE